MRRGDNGICARRTRDVGDTRGAVGHGDGAGWDLGTDRLRGRVCHTLGMAVGTAGTREWMDGSRGQWYPGVRECEGGGTRGQLGPRGVGQPHLGTGRQRHPGVAHSGCGDGWDSWDTETAVPQDVRTATGRDLEVAGMWGQPSLVTWGVRTQGQVKSGHCWDKGTAPPGDTATTTIHNAVHGDNCDTGDTATPHSLCPQTPRDPHPIPAAPATHGP